MKTASSATEPPFLFVFYRLCLYAGHQTISRGFSAWSNPCNSPMMTEHHPQPSPTSMMTRILRIYGRGILGPRIVSTALIVPLIGVLLLTILVRTLRLKIISASIWHPVNLTTVVLVPAIHRRCIVWLGRRKGRNRSILVWRGRGLRDRNWNVLVWQWRVSRRWHATNLSLSLLKLPLGLCCFGSESCVLEFCTKDFFIGYETSEHVT